MKKIPYQVLISSTEQLMQQHAFDHLSDDKLNRMRSSFRKLAADNPSLKERKKCEEELLNFYYEADLYGENTTLKSVNDWCAAMSYLGLNNVGNNLTEEN
jgi:hypothetical protein